MGNQNSSSSSPVIDIDRLRPLFARNIGALGLNRTELDKRCQPSGLYGTCQWDDKAIRRLIADGRIAARLKGEECPDSSCGATEECPICFLSYSDVNVTKCCNASICTECFLQVRPQKEKQSTCPFCNCENLSVVIAKKKDNIDNFDSCVPGAISATSLSASSGTSSSSSSTSGDSGKKKSAASVAPHKPMAIKKHNTGFGSELEKDERFKNVKKRSESFASTEGTNTPKTEKEIIESIAMTSEERQRLEDEMRAQHYHPLVLQLEAEAQERRLQHDGAYRSSTGGSSRSNARSHRAADMFRNHSIDSGGDIRSRRVRVRDGSSTATRNWNQLARFFDQGEDIDDMVALEAAIMFSMGEEERRSTSSSSSSNENGGEDNDQHRATRNNNSSSNNINNNNNNNNNTNREQQGGLPLLRSLLTGQLDNNDGSASSDSTTAAARNSSSSSSRRQRNLMRSSLGALAARQNHGMGDVALDTASLMMRGISEEEQISMAIAASMQDQQSDDDDDDNSNSNGNEASGEGDKCTSNSENNSNADSSSDDNAGSELHPDSVEDSSLPLSSSPIAPVTEPLNQQLKQLGSGDEASTITELARVVTDSAAPNADAIINGIAA